MGTMWAAFHPCCGRFRWADVHGLEHRRVGFDQGQICKLNGAFIPFAQTKAERIASGDPRLSLQERYGSHGLCGAVKAASRKAVAERFLLPADAERLFARPWRARSWPIGHDRQTVIRRTKIGSGRGLPQDGAQWAR